MVASSSTATAPAAHPLVIQRTFDAPRELVFKAWVDPKHLVRWLGPEGFTGRVIEIDARPGGAYRFHMRSAGGAEYWQRAYFERWLSLSDSFAPASGPTLTAIQPALNSHDGNLRGA